MKTYLTVQREQDNTLFKKYVCLRMYFKLESICGLFYEDVNPTNCNIQFP